MIEERTPSTPELGVPGTYHPRCWYKVQETRDMCEVTSRSARRFRNTCLNGNKLVWNVQRHESKFRNPDKYTELPVPRYLYLVPLLGLS